MIVAAELAANPADRGLALRLVHALVAQSYGRDRPVLPDGLVDAEVLRRIVKARNSRESAPLMASASHFACFRRAWAVRRVAFDSASLAAL